MPCIVPSGLFSLSLKSPSGHPQLPFSPSSRPEWARMSSAAISPCRAEAVRLFNRLGLRVQKQKVPQAARGGGGQPGGYFSSEETENQWTVPPALGSRQGSFPSHWGVSPCALRRATGHACRAQSRARTLAASAALCSSPVPAVLAPADRSPGLPGGSVPPSRCGSSG